MSAGNLNVTYSGLRQKPGFLRKYWFITLDIGKNPVSSVGVRVLRNRVFMKILVYSL